MSFGFGSDTYMPVDTVDDTAAHTEMQGPSSSLNEMAGRQPWSMSPTKSLLGLWFFALALYMFSGWFFRGQRS